MIQATNSHDHTGKTAFGEPPRFQSAEHWLAHYYDSIERGDLPWPPSTRDELLLADDAGLLETHSHWIPSRIGLRLLQLPEHFGRTLEPYGERFKERFLQTLISDDEFASAIFNLIQGEG